ncbi:MAG: M14 family metallopeptidase [Phycisphaerae bacterium]|jgi:hypothetical protein
MGRWLLVCGVAVVVEGLAGCTADRETKGGLVLADYIAPEALPDAWRTRAERTDYAETGRYDEIVDFCRRLGVTSPYACCTTFGLSAAGRPLPLLILSRDGAFTPEAAAATDKLIVLVQNCIHPGECAGKDASLALARDILITGEQRELLDHVILVIMPIFNADGHERFGPHSRINQNGPREMGWRVTATNLNLNRDYTKADAVEMRCWLRCWRQWQPDMLIDNHTTNGADHRYDLFYAIDSGPAVDAELAAWIDGTLLPAVLSPLADEGHLVLPYSGLRDAGDPGQGVQAVVSFGPRFSTGYGAMCNRPTLLLEAHAFKSYERRVRVTYDFMWHVLRELNRDPAALRRVCSAADDRTCRQLGAGEDGQLVLTQARSDESEPIIYHGYEIRRRNSEITGGQVLEYGDAPVDVETRLYQQARAERTVAPPAAYLVPAEWGDVIARLRWHGVLLFRLRHAARLEVETYRFEHVELAARSYEGRQRPSYEVRSERSTEDYDAGAVFVVPMDQPRARLVGTLLEPASPDSLVAWGLMNAIFEQKEYCAGFVMEPIAQRMRAEDPALAAEFAERLATDEKFAADGSARLDFFYRRSPYWDERLNVYPIVRLPDREALARLRAEAQR